MRNSLPLVPRRTREIRLLTAGTAADLPKIRPTVAVVVPSTGIGPRKLVRPVMPARAAGSRAPTHRDPSPMLTHQMTLEAAAAAQDGSHAEAFYFQKQVQSQTPMVFVLEDGERVEGFIEWYDRNSIKVRNSGRALIYKSSIKYLFKASELQP